MKNLFYYFLIISAFLCSTSFAERYKSLSERSDQSGTRGYSERSGSTSGYGAPSGQQRYESKPRSDKEKFDQNLNRYNRYSPSEKKEVTEKWRSFKQNTTPEERQFIMEKMRNRRQDGGGSRSGRSQRQ